MISLQSQDSLGSSRVPQFKSVNPSVLSLLYNPTLTFIHDYWKNHSFDYTDLGWQSNVSSFLICFLTCCLDVDIAFLPRSKRLLISWLQLPSAAILKPKKIKSLTVSIVSPSICHEVTELDAMVLVFLMLSFKPAFSLSSLTFFKSPFSSSSLSAIRVMSSAYLRLLIFLPEILILACASSSQAFHMIYSA